MIRQILLRVVELRGQQTIGRRRLTAALLVLCQMVGPPAYAQQQQQSRERDAVRRAQMATQKAEQEKAQLQEQNAKLEKEKQELSAKLKTSQQLKGKLATAKQRETEQSREIERLGEDSRVDKARIAALEGKLQQLNAQIAEEQEAQRHLGGQLKAYEEKVAQQLEIIARQSQAVQSVDEKNLKLYQLNADLMDRYKRKGVWDSLMQREPFTQIRDVQIEAILQEYRDKNDGLKKPKPEVQQ
jgi:DNA repair exonuclease SbcCD ATPase subunit